MQFWCTVNDEYMYCKLVFYTRPDCKKCQLYQTDYKTFKLSCFLGLPYFWLSVLQLLRKSHNCQWHIVLVWVGDFGFIRDHDSQVLVCLHLWFRFLIGREPYCPGNLRFFFWRCYSSTCCWHRSFIVRCLDNTDTLPKVMAVSAYWALAHKNEY